MKSLLIAAAACLLSLPQPPAKKDDALGDSKPTPRRAVAGRTPAKSADPALTSEREKAALDFVREHHSELLGVLVPLKDMDRGQYERAISDLARTREHLAELQAKDPKRHGLLLQSWQTKSQIELKAATFARSADPAIEKELRALLRRQIEIQIAIATLEKERLAERIAKVDSEIEKLRSKTDEAVDQRMKRLAKLRPVRATAKKKLEAGSRN